MTLKLHILRDVDGHQIPDIQSTLVNWDNIIAVDKEPGGRGSGLLTTLGAVIVVAESAEEIERQIFSLD